MGDPLGGNTLTTKLMIENRQSSGEFVAGLASLSALGSRGADRKARAAHADRMRQWSANFCHSTPQLRFSTMSRTIVGNDSTTGSSPGDRLYGEAGM
jgi:hypothetical protein